MRLSQLKIVAIFLLAMVFAPLIYAQAVVVNCDQDKKQVQIKYVWDSSQKDWTNLKRIIFFDLLVVKKCGPEHRYPGDACSVNQQRSKVATCKLGVNQFSMKFEPYPFNDDLQGACGAVVSGVVAISKNGKKLREPVAFDESGNCHDHTVRVVSEITIDGKTSDV
jgi:hypothetical protein